MKHKIFAIIGFVLLPVVFLTAGIFYGWNSGFSAGNATGFELGKVISYEKGYVSGYDNGKEYVVTHLEQYVTVPKVVKYDEVVKFLEEDRTDSNKYSYDSFDCVSFSNMLRSNAIARSIKCGIVSFDLVNSRETIGHVIVCFETTDQGIVYFDPQTDGQRYGIYVGSTYTLQGIVYKITKVDVIW